MGGILDEDPYFESKICVTQIRNLREEIAEFCKKYNFDASDWFKMGDLVTRLEAVSFKHGQYQREIYEAEKG